MPGARQSPDQPAHGAEPEKAQETVELRLLPGPPAPWRRLWDWLLAPVSNAGADPELEEQHDPSR